MITSYQYKFTAPPHHYRYIERATESATKVGLKKTSVVNSASLSEVLNQNIEIEADQVWENIALSTTYLLHRIVPELISVRGPCCTISHC